MGLRLPAALVVCAGFARAGTLDVPGTYPTIGAALAAAAPGDTVLVQPGVYHEAVTIATAQVTLLAAGSPDDTVIDASGLGASTIHIADGANTAVVDGFTVSGGVGTYVPALEARLGGGIYVEPQHVIVRRCHVVGNVVRHNGPNFAASGGGIYMSSGVAEDCSIVGNTSAGYGGGVMGGVLHDCSLSGNSAVYGGGCAWADLIGCALEDNAAQEGGGAMYGEEIRGCTFRHNTSEQDGGGLWGPQAKVEDCLFEGNSAGRGGGLADPSASGAERCRFVGNRATRGGGVAWGGTFTSCAFVRNTADLGSAGYATESVLFRFGGCTLIDNGLACAGTLELRDCIVRGRFKLDAPTLTVFWCDVEGGWAGEGNFDADPLFVDPAAGDVHLQPGSPCVNAGEPGIPFPPLFGEDPTDIDDEPRVQGGTMDVGCDELASDCNGNGVPDWQDLLAGTSADVDGNGVPDECHQVVLVPADQPTLQAALDVVPGNATILVQPGVLTGPGNVDLVIKNKLDLFIVGQTDAAECIIDLAGAGDAFQLQNSELTLRGLTIRNGVSTNGGALYAHGGSVAHVLDCRLLGNTAVGKGGAVDVESGTLVDLTRCVLADNTAGVGGAVAVSNSSCTATSCTFEGNAATGALPGGTSKGGTLKLTDVAHATLRDCILWGGAATDGAEIHAAGSAPVLDVAWCDVAGGKGGLGLQGGVALAWGDGNLDADPHFKDAAAQDVHLSGGSPCIDSGDPAGLPDADGTPPDMGALPFEPFTDLGYALAGALGSAQLSGAGTASAGEAIQLALVGAAPAARATLVLGAGLALLPFKGGVLVPPADMLLGPFPVLPDGTLELDGHLPADAPSGFIVALQFWWPDAGGPEGFAASNGMTLEVR